MPQTKPLGEARKLTPSFDLDVQQYIVKFKILIKKSIQEIISFVLMGLDKIAAFIIFDIEKTVAAF